MRNGCDREVKEDPRCVAARRALSLALDGEAGTVHVLALAAHVERCPRCRRFAAEVVAFTRELRSSLLGSDAMRRVRDHPRGGKR